MTNRGLLARPTTQEEKTKVLVLKANATNSGLVVS
jgi:hypothetical protein